MDVNCICLVEWDYLKYKLTLIVAICVYYFINEITYENFKIQSVSRCLYLMQEIIYTGTFHFVLILLNFFFEICNEEIF